MAKQHSPDCNYKKSGCLWFDMHVYCPHEEHKCDCESDTFVCKSKEVEEKILCGNSVHADIAERAFRRGEEQERERAVELIRPISEIYIGMEGQGGAKTAPEEYQEHILKEMYAETVRAIKLIKND